MNFSPASYDGEPCIQVVIRAETGSAELEEKLREISSQDLVTGLFNRSHFNELLDAAAERAVKASQPSSPRTFESHAIPACWLKSVSPASTCCSPTSPTSCAPTSPATPSSPAMATTCSASCSRASRPNRRPRACRIC
jgi:hypothetical protein